jgi:SLOG family YspA-like protein
MRVLVTGSRDWQANDLVWKALRLCLDNSHGPMTVVHGACPTGADEQAHQWCEKFGANSPGAIIEEPHPADWSQGKFAGFARNAEMVNLGADLCLAFQRNKSKGTQHTMDLCNKAGIIVIAAVEG